MPPRIHPSQRQNGQVGLITTDTPTIPHTNTHNDNDTDSDVSPTDIPSKLDTHLTDLTAAFEPILSHGSWSDALDAECDPSDPLERAKANVMLAYTLVDLVWVYLKTRGINPDTHPVAEQLERVRGYYAKIREIEFPEKRKTKIDVAAAGRFISHAIPKNQRLQALNGNGSAETSAASAARAGRERAMKEHGSGLKGNKGEEGERMDVDESDEEEEEEEEEADGEDDEYDEEEEEEEEEPEPVTRHPHSESSGPSRSSRMKFIPPNAERVIVGGRSALANGEQDEDYDELEGGGQRDVMMFSGDEHGNEHGDEDDSEEEEEDHEIEPEPTESTDIDAEAFISNLEAEFSNAADSINDAQSSRSGRMRGRGQGGEQGRAGEGVGKGGTNRQAGGGAGVRGKRKRAEDL